MRKFYPRPGSDSKERLLSVFLPLLIVVLMGGSSCYAATVDEGWQALLDNDLGTAEPLLRACVKQNPDDLDAWDGLAIALWTRGDMPKAAEIWMELARRGNAAEIELDKILEKFLPIHRGKSPRRADGPPRPGRAVRSPSSAPVRPVSAEKPPDERPVVNGAELGAEGPSAGFEQDPAFVADVLDGLIGFLGLAAWAGLSLGAAWKLYLAGLERQSGSKKALRRLRDTGLYHLEGLLAFLPPDVGALALKQLRYILRSTPGRLALLMSPVLGLMIGFMQRSGPAVLLNLPIHDTAFLVLCLMASINVFQLTANRFQWDGGGAVLYFVAPVDAAHVIFGLDVGLWLFQSLTGFGMLAAFVIVSGVPGPGVLLSGLLLYLGGQILSLIGGSVLSILFPSPRDIGTARNQLPMLSSLAMLAVSACTTLVFGIPALLLQWFFPAAAPPILLLLLLSIIVVYRLVQPHVGRLLSKRREGLLAALKSRPG